jgi:hypothetical protein
MGEACAFSALFRAHVPCDVRIGIEGFVTVFSFLVVVLRE